MGWGITIKDVELRDVKKKDVEFHIEESEEKVSYCKERLLIIGASSPMQREGESHSNWADYVQGEVSIIMEDLKDEYFKLKLLYIAREFPEDVKDF